MEIINLSQRTTAGLAGLENLSRETLISICKYILQMLIANKSNIVIDETLEDSLAAISTLLLEAAKIKAEPIQISNILKEQGLSNEKAEIIFDLFSQHRQSIIDHLEITGISSPTIVGLEWRLDYSLRSKEEGQISLPMFFVSLQVKDRGLLHNIDMIASREELQDMLSKVKDAVKQVERVLNMNDTS